MNIIYTKNIRKYAMNVTKNIFYSYACSAM